MASTTLTAESVAPMRQRQSLEFPYKHSTGETVGRFLAGLKEQKRIWGQRVNGQGVVVPPLGYSEVDGSDGGEWVEVKSTGVITAAARVDHPIERLHLSTTPFAFVLVKLDGADTALAHIVRSDLDRVAVGARVQAIWTADEARVGSIRDIDSFQVIGDAPPPKRAPAPAPKVVVVAKPQPAATPKTVKVAKPVPTAKSKKSIATKKPVAARKKAAAKKAVTTKRTKVTKKTAKPAKPTKQKTAAKKAAVKKPTKATRPKVAKAKPARAKPRRAKPSKKKVSAKKPVKRPAKIVRSKAKKGLRRR